MEHFNFLFLFLAVLQISVCVLPPSQRLKVFYVLCMLFRFLENTWMYTVYVHARKSPNSLFSLSLSSLSFLPFLNTHAHMHKSVHCILNPSVGFKCWSPQGASNCPKFVKDFDASEFQLSLTDPQRQDPGVPNHFQLSLSTGLNHSGRSKFAYQILAGISVEFQ